MKEEKKEALKIVGLIVIAATLVSLGFNAASIFIAEIFGAIGYLAFLIVLVSGLLYYIYRDEVERQKHCS